MRPSTPPTAARTAAVVLAFLCVLAAYNTVLVIAAVDREGGGAGVVVACAVTVAITVALGCTAAWMWRRGSGGA